MRLKLITILVILFAVNLVFAQLKLNSTPRSEVSNPSKFQFLTLNGQAVATATEPCEKSLTECGNERIGLFGYEGFGGPDSDNPKIETFTFKSGRKTVGVYLLTMKLEEDDFAGERVRLSFENKGNKWHFVQAGRQFKCARGANTKTWTKNLCP